MKTKDEIAAGLGGPEEHRARRVELLGAILGAFESGGRDAVEALLRERMDGLGAEVEARLGALRAMF